MNDNGVQAWAPPTSEGERHPTYIESIFSMATGQYETAMSIRVKDENDPKKNKVLVLVYPFSTVNNIYLEPNYQFAVINQSGMIQYHSNASKINNENIIDESNQDDNLKAYLQNGSKVHMNLKISLKDYSVYLTPIKNTSFYFITMYDIKKSRLTISSSMATTFQFILAILVYLILIHGLLRLERFLSKYPSSKAVTYYFLDPSKTKSWVYYKLATLNVATILFLLLVYRYNALHLVNSAILFFSTITAASLYNYNELTRQKRRILELTYPFRKIPLTIFEFALLALTFFWMGLYFFRNFNFKHYSELLALLYPFLILGLFVFSKKFQKKVSESNVHSVNTKVYRAYYLHAFSWIFILSIVSTILFFKPIYNRQHLKRVTHNLQEEYFERVKLQNWTKHKLNINDPINATIPVHEDVVNNSNKNSSHSDENDSIHYDDGTRDLLDAISIYFDKEDSNLKGLHKSANLVVHLTRDADRTFFSLNIDPYEKFYNSKNTKVLPTTIRTFSLPNFSGTTKENVESLFFWVALVIALLALYQTIVHLSEKFFHLNLAQDLLRISPREKLKLHSDKNDIIGLDWSKKNILLIGLPFSGRNSFLKQAVRGINLEIESHNKENQDKEGLNSIKLIDFTQRLSFDFINSTSDILAEVKEADLNMPIVINNYDYGITDFADNENKLIILEYILGQKTIDRRNNFLVLIGSIDIYQIIDIYRSSINYLIASGGDKDVIDTRKKDVTRWESVLYSFTKHIIPMLQKEEKDNKQPKSQVRTFIYSELNFTGFLSNLIPHLEKYSIPLVALGEGRDSLEAKIIQEIQSMAENYYFSLWNSFSKEEKFILLDLAQDDLINTANEKVIKNLIRKGVIVLNPNLQIFNKSFANFILESISEEESNQFELEARKGGIWNSYKYLVIFLVIIIVIFLSFVEEQAFTQLTGIVSLGAAMMPKILSTIGSFTNKRKVI